MRKEIEALKRGLAGHLRLAVIPTAIPVTADLTAPFAERHPEVGFTVLSRSSVDILGLLENLEIDAGVTYLDNEPLGRVHAIPLYRERYRLLIPSSFPLARQERVTWAEAARAPLCLLTPDMQNRRIIDALLKEAGMTLSPSLESNSLITLFAHVATGRWASVMPAKLADFFGLAGDFRSIPIVGPDVSHAIGLVVPPREPMTPLTAALARYARAIAPTLDADWDEIAVRAR
jgi:DNA-binding transcriptional LysR family regulator